MTSVRRLQLLLTVAVVAYLTLERSHAEELGGGGRAIADVLRGDRPLTPVTWVGLVAVVVALAVPRLQTAAAGRERGQLP